MFHRQSWFPALVTVLTVALAVIIIALFRGRVPTTATTAISPVTEAQYQSNVKQIVGTLPAQLTAAASDDARVTLLSNDRDALLNLTVPADQRDLHLNMVMTINAWIAGYQGDAVKLAAAQTAWNQIVQENAWIQ